MKNESFMDNIFTLKKGESITKSILFTVQNKDNYTLNYTEYYEDEFKGDTFSVELTPKDISSAKGDGVTEQSAQKDEAEE